MHIYEKIKTTKKEFKGEYILEETNNKLDTCYVISTKDASILLILENSNLGKKSKWIFPNGLTKNQLKDFIKNEYIFIYNELTKDFELITETNLNEYIGTKEIYTN
jgi:hypothetical protein